MFGLFKLKPDEAQDGQRVELRVTERGEAMAQVWGTMVVGSDSFAAVAAGNYGAADVVAESVATTEGSPLRGFEASRVPGGTGYLASVRLSTNNTSWAAGFRVDLYNTPTPDAPLTGDNVASAQKFQNRAQFLGSFEVATMSVPTGADFCRGIRDDLRIPFKCAEGDTKIYYRLVLLAAEANEAAGQIFRLDTVTDSN